MNPTGMEQQHKNKLIYITLGENSVTSKCVPLYTNEMKCKIEK